MPQIECANNQPDPRPPICSSYRWPRNFKWGFANNQIRRHQRVNDTYKFKSSSAQITVLCCVHYM